VEGGVVGLALALLFLAGVAWLGRRALVAVRRSADRAVILGALFGVVSLAVHSLGDFSLHIPGVGFTAVLLIARVCAVGLAAPSGAPAAPEGAAIPSRMRRLALGSATLAACGFSLTL